MLHNLRLDFIPLPSAARIPDVGMRMALHRLAHGPLHILERRAPLAEPSGEEGPFRFAKRARGDAAHAQRLLRLRETGLEQVGVDGWCMGSVFEKPDKEWEGRTIDDPCFDEVFLDVQRRYDFRVGNVPVLAARAEADERQQAASRGQQTRSACTPSTSPPPRTHRPRSCSTSSVRATPPSGRWSIRSSDGCSRGVWWTCPSSIGRGRRRGQRMMRSRGCRLGGVGACWMTTSVANAR